MQESGKDNCSQCISCQQRKEADDKYVSKKQYQDLENQF